MEITIVQKLAIWVLPTLFAITLHEVAHGWVASWFGDYTARLAGRLTVNPLKHIDPVGTIVLPLITMILGNFIFGWAKPVPVDMRNMRHPRRDIAIVALAGPVANLLMAVLWAGIARLGLALTMMGNAWFGEPIWHMGIAGIMINSVLCVLNILPLPPLDGGRVMLSLLPKRIAYHFSQIEPYSIFILLLLMFSGVLYWIMMPPVLLITETIEYIFGLGFAIPT